MQVFIDFLINFWNLTVMIGLYVLIGLIFVGIAHLYISKAWIQKHLGEDSNYPTLKGALYGIPLPLCSCGVIPLATSLREKGASKKAVTSFFITTPMTGIDSIIATYGVFGLPMALLRVVSSFISGIVAGSLVKDELKNDTHKEESSCGCSGSCSTPKEEKPKQLKDAIHYALEDVFKDLAKPMFYGLILATIFLLVMPKESVVFFNENLLLSYLIVLLLSLPLYVCSISAIPIALSMLSVGVSPGVAFIFLTAAPATNIITAGIIKKILGNEVLIKYLISIIVTTIIFALMIDFMMPSEWFTIISNEISVESHSYLDIAGGILFLILLGVYLLKK